PALAARRGAASRPRPRGLQPTRRTCRTRRTRRTDAKVPVLTRVRQLDRAFRARTANVAPIDCRGARRRAVLGFQAGGLDAASRQQSEDPRRRLEPLGKGYRLRATGYGETRSLRAQFKNRSGGLAEALAKAVRSAPAGPKGPALHPFEMPLQGPRPEACGLWPTLRP